MLYDTNVKILSDVDMNNELENLIIKKSSEIGQLQNKIEEQSLQIDNLRKLLEKIINEKIDIIFKKPSCFLVFKYLKIISFSNAVINLFFFD